MTPLQKRCQELNALAEAGLFKDGADGKAVQYSVDDGKPCGVLVA